MEKLFEIRKVCRCGVGSGRSGQGAKSQTDTVDCLSSGYSMLAKVRLLSISSTLFTKGLLLLVQTNYLKSTASGLINQDGSELP